MRWKPKHILVPTDFSSDANRAGYYAATMAEPWGSKVTLFHVIALFEYDPNDPSHHFPNAEEIYKSMEAAATRQMGEIHNKHKHVKFKNVMVRGISPAEEILRYAGENNVDLIVMGTHGRSGLSHFLLGSVAEKVIRHMPCPVMTIRYRDGEDDQVPSFKRIVVPIDFSAYSKQAVNYAVEIASKFDATLEFIHVIEEQIHPAYYVTGESSIFELIPDLRERSIDAMKEFVEEAIPKGLAHTFHVREGRAYQAIVKFAEEQNADLIVIATHGLSGLDYLLLGSTTEKVVRKSKTPVLAIRAEMK